MQNQSGMDQKFQDFIYDEKDLIGTGTTGHVYRGNKVSDKTTIAVKVIKEAFGNSDIKYDLLHNQLKACKAIHHKNIFTIFETFRRNGCTYIFSEFCEGGTLRSLIKKKGTLSQIQALYIFQALLDGLSEITGNKIIHRDLKSENILLRGNGEPVIIDFGVCDFVDNNASNKRNSYNVGSPGYMSPQAYNQNQYSEKSDIWSLGIVLAEMVTGSLLKMNAKNMDKYFKELKKRSLPEIKLNFKNQVLNILLKKCLSVSIYQRASTAELREIIEQWKKRNNGKQKFLQVQKEIQQLFKEEQLALQQKKLRLQKIKSQKVFQTQKKQLLYPRLKLGSFKSPDLRKAEKYTPRKSSQKPFALFKKVNSSSTSSLKSHLKIDKK